MSLTLGEKLRQAREERGITLSEVAEQTRISSIYLEAIDHDDYRNLPGGIFNRGFVKSYAKYVGVDEQEALLDYSRLQNEIESAPAEDNVRAYRPEVLTDDRSGSSMTPTVIMAAVILAVMTIGILFLVSYLRKPAEPAANVAVTTNTNAEPPIREDGGPGWHGAPELATSTIELKAIARPVKVFVTVDGEPPKQTNIGEASTAFNPKESLTLNYLRWNASAVQLAINGKSIALPTEPLEPKDKDRIIFTISKNNFAQIWNSGAILQNAAPPSDANTMSEPSNTAAQNSASQQRSTPAPKAPPPRANTAQTPRPAEPPKANTATRPALANKPPQ